MVKVCDEFCRNCCYVQGGQDRLMNCHYFEKENRLRPCPPGKGCAVKKTMKQLQVEKRAQKRAESMRTVVCVICGKEFQTTDGKRKHCSAECLTEARRRAARAYNARKKASAANAIDG